MIDFKTLETFVWVATLGSFRGAAEKLNTSQPAISQRIGQLEEALDLRLFQRDSHSTSPTAPGRKLLKYVERCDRTATSGVLRLGVAETIVHTWLSSLLKDVYGRYPSCRWKSILILQPTSNASCWHKRLTSP
jgi:DNA-binding transcriptional LysR family regulator